MIPNITLAICTWNRSAVLDGTLRRVAELAVPPGVTWEVVVVDNNSTDDTPRVIESFAARLPIRRVFEARQGIAIARNTAVAAANGGLLIFLDSDCRPGPDLLRLYWEASRDRPDATIFGGTIEPTFEAPPPAWIADNLDLLAPAYARLVRPGGDRELSATESVITCNMAVRTAAVRSYPFDTGMGRVGHGRDSGEEIDLYVRMVADGHKAYWVGGARVSHYILAETLTESHVYRSFQGEGRLEVRMTRGRVPPCPTVAGAPRWAVRQHVAARLSAWRHSGPKSRAWLVAFLRSAFTDGVIEEARRLRKGHAGAG